MDTSKIRRGSIVWVDLDNHPGMCVQSGIRPCIVVSNNKGNKNSFVVVPGTSKIGKTYLPVHVLLYPNKTNYLNRKTLFMPEQMVTVDKKQVLYLVGELDSESETMKLINKAIISELQLY